MSQPIGHDPRHVPVMLDRCVELLAPVNASGAVVVDNTLGLGGHASALLDRLPDIRLVGIDRDGEALAAAADRLHRFGDRAVLRRGVFDEAGEILDDLGVGAPSAYLYDLGVSSLQLDSDQRGFAYSRDTPLDMRMDLDGPLTAADVVNGYSTEELARVIGEYGEERRAMRIAVAIDRRRKKAPIESTKQLADIVDAAIPAPGRRAGHPAKRVFQALRIEVNDELGALSRGLAAAIDRVAVDGRIVVMSYHSLEDRIAKRLFARAASTRAPADLPVVPVDAQPFLEMLTRGAEAAPPAEIDLNRRSASVRLRAARKIAAAPTRWRAA